MRQTRLQAREPQGAHLTCVGDGYTCIDLHPVCEEAPVEGSGPSSPSPDTPSRKFQTLRPEAVTLITP